MMIYSIALDKLCGILIWYLIFQIFGPLQLIQQIINPWEWVMVLDGYLIPSLVVYIHPPMPILLEYYDDEKLTRWSVLIYDIAFIIVAIPSSLHSILIDFIYNPILGKEDSNNNWILCSTSHLGHNTCGSWNFFHMHCMNQLF